MPDISELLAFTLGAIALGWAACFAIGSSWNLKRGNDVLRWLREALPALGERTTMQWLGTSAVKLTIARAKDPFKDVEIVIAMEPRDVPALWLHGHLNGRRDTLIIRGHLRQPPNVEVEVVNPALWTGREALSEINQSAWSKVSLNGEGDSATRSYVAVANGAQGTESLREWFSRSLKLAPALARISVRRAAQYQLQWHSSVPKLTSVSATEIIELVRQIGKQASG